MNVSEDAELRLVTLLAESAPKDMLGSNFAQSCKASISASDVSALLKTIVSDKGAIKALTLLTVDESTSAMSILAALLQRSSDSAMALSLGNAIAALSDDGDEIAAKRKVLLLSVLYNMRSNSNEKVALLNKIFQVAAKHPTSLLTPESSFGSLLVGDIPPLVTLLDSWQIQPSDRRELYQTLGSVLTDNRKQQFQLLLVDSYRMSPSEGIFAAKEAAIGAIRDPISLFSHQRNLLQQPAIQALEKADPVLHGLLQVFQEGMLSDYQTYVKSGEEIMLKRYGLDPQLCQQHMRTLSLCSLAQQHEEIPFTLVADKLQVAPDQVETVVVAAVSSGLLQAKMDQMTQVVLVERCTVRQFDTAQWKGLQTRLLAWRDNVGGILAAMKEASLVK